MKGNLIIPYLLFECRTYILPSAKYALELDDNEVLMALNQYLLIKTKEYKDILIIGIENDRDKILLFKLVASELKFLRIILAFLNEVNDKSFILEENIDLNLHYYSDDFDYNTDVLQNGLEDIDLEDIDTVDIDSENFKLEDLFLRKLIWVIIILWMIEFVPQRS